MIGRFFFVAISVTLLSLLASFESLMQGAAADRSLGGVVPMIFVFVCVPASIAFGFIVATVFVIFSNLVSLYRTKQ